MVKLQKPKIINLMSGVSIACLGLVAVLTLCPSAAENANAEDTVALSVGANVASVVSVALSDTSATADITPKADGTLGYTNTRVTIGTNNRSGYSVSMTAAKGSLDNTTPGITDKINTLQTKDGSAADGGITMSNAKTNTWGYSLIKDGTPATDETIFKPVPSSSEISNVVLEAETGSNNDQYNLAFGIKVDSTLAQGTYRDEVIISAIANPATVNYLSDLVYMQDMAHDICENSPTEPADGSIRQLIDTRDGKLYWVAKLKDGNCWMTQNLDLDITANMIALGNLNSSNTDLGYMGTGQVATQNGTIWSSTPTSSSSTDGINRCGSDTTDPNCKIINSKARYLPTATININKHNQLPGKDKPSADAVAAIPLTTTRSYDVGEYIVSRPFWGENCGTYVTWAGMCTQVGIIDVSDSSKWQPTYDSAADLENKGKTDKEYKAIKCSDGADIFNDDGSALSSVCTGGEYDPHYLVGNYYTYNAATAGSGGSRADNANAANSICPKGWKLPTGQRDDSNVPIWENGSLAHLFIDYDMPLKTASDHVNDGVHHLVESDLGTVFSSPFYFSGTSSVSAVDLNGLGGYGYLWTSTGQDKIYNHAAALYHSKTTVVASSIWPRNIGFHVRCLAR